MDNWVTSTKRVSDYPMLQHRYSKEYGCFGRHGEVWEDGSDYKVLVRGRVKSTVYALVGNKNSIGTRDCEAVTKVSRKQIAEVMKLIGVFKTASKQLELANG